MFSLAHFSDPHIGPLPKARVRELAGKRVLGWVNWHQGRHEVHRMDVLDTLLRDLHAQAPDHIALTGDVVNLALPGEYEGARTFLERVGPPDRLSVVPGNHDAYTKNGIARTIACFDPWMRGDASGAHPLSEAERFPYLRVRGRVALIGLSSAVPTGPFMATGKVGVLQMSRLNDMLTHLDHEGYCRVVMIHHPVRRQDAPPTAILLDNDRLLRVLREAGAELVLHGHIHSGLMHQVKGPRGAIPVVCAPSASATPGRARWPAAFNLFHIGGEPGAWTIDLEVRGLTAPAGPAAVVRRERLAA